MDLKEGIIICLYIAFRNNRGCDNLSVGFGE